MSCALPTFSCQCKLQPLISEKLYANLVKKIYRFQRLVDLKGLLQSLPSSYLFFQNLLIKTKFDQPDCIPTMSVAEDILSSLASSHMQVVIEHKNFEISKSRAEIENQTRVYFLLLFQKIFFLSNFFKMFVILLRLTCRAPFPTLPPWQIHVHPPFFCSELSQKKEPESLRTYKSIHKVPAFLFSTVL